MQASYLDFETMAALSGQVPEPVGLAYALSGQRAAWTTDPGKMRWVWQQASLGLVVGHGLTFDLSVARRHLGVPYPAHVWDTMVGAFLLNPFALDLGLKTLTQRDTGERDELQAWIAQHYGARLGQPGGKKWAEYIGQAARDSREGERLVARYARSDIDMTRELHRSQIGPLRGSQALTREMGMPAVLSQMKLDGLHIDRKGLEEAAAVWREETIELERYLLHRLGVDTGQAGHSRGTLNCRPELAAALREAGLLAKSLPDTDKGQIRTDWDALEDCVGDVRWLAAWRARQGRRKVLTTYTKPWLEIVDADDRIHADWFSTRGSNTEGRWGARTGRLVSSPNLQNIAKSMDRYELPEGFPVKLGPAPALRQYVTPAPGHVLLRRDYNQQELRILAHFEGDKLMRAYQDDPRLDMHSWAQQMIRQQTGLSIDRGPVKTTGFGILYGSGAASLSRRLKVDYEEARQIRNAYLSALPGIRKVQDELSALELTDESYWTWGGRPYKIEQTTEKVAASEWGPEHEVTKSFAFRALNYLIQGSAADCTKQAMLNYDRARKHGRMVCCVHDEMIVEVPREHARTEMKLLKEAMEAVEFRAPMLSDGVVCRRSWAEAKQ